MTRKLPLALAVAGSLALAACATNPEQIARAEAKQAAKVQPYLDHAGEPVSSFRLFGHVSSWNPLSDHQLVVRTGVNDSYLLEVDRTCQNLTFANFIGLVTRTGNTVQSGFDYVRFDDGFQGQRCRITEIRPVDADAAQKEIDAAS